MPPEHPYRRYATAQLRGGLVAVVLAIVFVGFAWSAFPPLALPCAVLGIFGAVVARMAASNRRRCDASMFHNHAYDLVARGELAQAEELLSRAPPDAGRIGQAIMYLRATIALLRADLGAAESWASRAIAVPGHWLERDPSPTHRVLAYGMRALVRSSLGKNEEAEADIAAVRRDANANAEALANVAVASMIGLARRGDDEGLARALDEARPLHELMPSRARALVVAFRRMLSARTSSAYREPARTDEGLSGDPQLVAWTATVAPEAGAYLPATTHRATTSPPSLARPGSVATPPFARPRVGRLVFLIFTLFLMIWVTGAVAGGENALPKALDLPILALSGAGSLGLCAFLFLRVRRALDADVASRLALRLAVRKIGEGNDGEAERLLQDLERNGPPGTTASARLELAKLAESHAKMTLALELCDAGLANLATPPVLRARHSDLLRPELTAERAFVLAALGRKEDAEAGLSALATEYPGFAYLTRSIFRVQLALALGRPEMTRARRLARERTLDLPLTMRDETLADAIVALETRHPGECERLRQMLATDAKLARWIEAMLPGARDQLAGTGPALPRA